MITQAVLKRWMDYHPDTGEFIWLQRPSNRVAIGARAGNRNQYGYWVVKLLGRLYRQHRLAFFYMTGRWPELVDHINGDRSDNRWKNLREVTSQQNSWNRSPLPRSRTGIKCVFPNGSGFKVQINYQGTIKYCGTYPTAELAQEVAELVQEMVQGEYKHGTIYSP